MGGFEIQAGHRLQRLRTPCVEVQNKYPKEFFQVMMARSIRLALLPLALALTSLAAHAETFDWTLTGPAASLGGLPETGSGTLTATDIGGKLTITSIDGTLGGS